VEQKFISLANYRKSVLLHKSDDYMCLIRIGERANHLSKDFCSATGHIPWNKIYRLRNIAAHEYEALRMPDIWIVADKDAPFLQKQIQEFMEK
jgi:uncharacterized protein with HEPN domain